MHYFQSLLILQTKMVCQYPRRIKNVSKKIPQTNHFGLPAEFIPHYIPIILRLHNTLLTAPYLTDYTIPCPSIASTTFSNPAILAPAT